MHQRDIYLATDAAHTNRGFGYIWKTCPGRGRNFLLLFLRVETPEDALLVVALRGDHTSKITAAMKRFLGSSMLILFLWIEMKLKVIGH